MNYETPLLHVLGDVADVTLLDGSVQPDTDPTN